MVQPYLTQLLAEQHVRDLHAAAARQRLAKAASAQPARRSLRSWFRAFMDRGQLGPGHVARAEASPYAAPVTSRCAT